MMITFWCFKTGAGKCLLYMLIEWVDRNSLENSGYTSSCLYSRVSMFRPKEYSPIYMSSEEIAECVGYKVLMEVGDSISLIVGDPKGF